MMFSEYDDRKDVRRWITSIIPMQVTVVKTALYSFLHYSRVAAREGSPSKEFPEDRDLFPHTFQVEASADSHRSFQEAVKVRFQAFPHSCRKAICLPC
jgi:hypothetical protein